jgi:hypothetical protein
MNLSDPKNAAHGNTAHRTVSRDSTVQWSGQPLSTVVGNEVVLMNLDRGRCYGLGPVGTDLWNKMSQPVRVADLLDQLLHEYSVEPTVLEHDVLEVLDRYAAEGLIDVKS